MSDDEYCDLETLEALLDADDHDDCDNESPTGGSHDQNQGVSQEMKEFLNAVSDESDDEVAGKSPLKKNVANTPNEGLAMKKMKNTKCDEKSNMEKKTQESVNESDELLSDKQSMSKKEVNAGGDPTTQALQKELLLMQKKMEEMQKMLLEQQNKNLTNISGVGTKIKIKPEEKKSPSQGNSCSNSTTKSSSKSLKLIMDDEEDPFFDCKNSSKSQGKGDKTKHIDKTKTDRNSKLAKPAVKATTSKELFGDSDSDWDDMDGESKSNLSEQGKSIKRLLKAGQREAHKPNFVIDDKDPKPQQSWAKGHSDVSQKRECRESPLNRSVKQEKEDKFSLKCNSSSSQQSKPQVSNATPNEKVTTEDFSRIRMINPLVSSAVMKMRMEGRKLISVSKINSRLNTPDLQGDWVTIGVVVGKTHTKTSSTGKTFSIWKLNDLRDLDNCVSFFLFGEVYKTHWKLDVGCVIGLLNPSMMEAMEKGKSEPAFTIKNPNQLMILGQSKDLGWCVARTKKGNKCSHFINKNQGDYCSYHVQAEYKKTAGKRLELQGSVTGIKPKSFEQKIFSKNSSYMYGGQAFTPNNASAKMKKSVSLIKLQQNSNSPHRINTLSLNDIVLPKKATSIGGSTGKITEDKDQLFMDMLSVPTPGSMQLVAHMKKDVSGSSSTKALEKSSKETVIQSVSAIDLLKQHKQMMSHKRLERKRASDLLLASSSDKTKASSQSNPLKEVPVLGKGLNTGQEVFFSTSPPTRKTKSSLADKSKLKAISLIQHKGGIGKEDPNAVRKQMEEKQLESIKKRVKSSDDSGRSPSLKPSSSSSNDDEPPKKKSRFLGDVDLNSAEVKAILKAKSKHKGALAEAEAEREEAYFSQLEKKERMEEKMRSITSIEISVYTCKQCKYTAQSALAQCKTDQHSIVKTKAKKRFFACKKCKERTTTITSQFPTDSCKKCGNLSYEKTSMYKERAGPKLESEILSHRGDEMKFLNSLHHKVYLNTVVDKD